MKEIGWRDRGEIEWEKERGRKPLTVFLYLSSVSRGQRLGMHVRGQQHVGLLLGRNCFARGSPKYNLMSIITF